MEGSSSPPPRPGASQQPPAAAPAPVPAAPPAEEHPAPVAPAAPAAPTSPTSPTSPAAPPHPAPAQPAHPALSPAHDAYQDAAQYPFPATDQTHQEADLADHHAVYSSYVHESASAHEGRNLEWMVPVVSGHLPPGHAPNGTAPEKLPTIHERLDDTLREAEEQQLKYATKAKYASWALNGAMFAQIIVNALVTALSAAPGSRSTQIGVSAMGAIGTILASFLVRLRGTQEPERSVTHSQNLERFIRELKGFKLDYGHSTDRKWDDTVNNFRREFDQLQTAVHQSENGQPMAAQKQGASLDASQKV